MPLRERLPVGTTALCLHGKRAWSPSGRRVAAAGAVLSATATSACSGESAAALGLAALAGVVIVARVLLRAAPPAIRREGRPRRDQGAADHGWSDPMLFMGTGGGETSGHDTGTSSTSDCGSGGDGGSSGDGGGGGCGGGGD